MLHGSVLANSVSDVINAQSIGKDVISNIHAVIIDCLPDTSQFLIDWVPELIPFVLQDNFVL
jgi:hypothetical protein